MAGFCCAARAPSPMDGGGGGEADEDRLPGSAITVLSPQTAAAGLMLQ